MRSASLPRPASLLAALVLCACGGAPPPAPRLADDLAAIPDTERKGLQLYVVLTEDPAAMQGPGAVDDMWKAVRGEAERYRAVRQHVQWVPGDYELDVTLDFADLPHAELAPERLAPLLEGLPPEARAQAERARLAVMIRSDTRVLPDGNHLRLAGLAPLFAADRWGGVIVDLLARRAWTADGWHAELAAPRLSARQVRLASRPDPQGGTELLTRGNAKYGVPDLVMRSVPRDRLPAARARFSAVQAALLTRGGKPGDTLPIAGAPPARLTPCGPDAGDFDASCVSVEAP